MTLKTDGVRLDELSSDPGSPATGDLWYNTTDDVLRVRESVTRTIEDKLNNFTATTDPTVNDDENDGYEVGSKWINTSSGILFFCKDNSVGAAVWIEVVSDAEAIGAAYREPINPGVLVTTGNSRKASDGFFSYIEYPNGSSNYATWNTVWSRDASTSIKMNMYFRLKAAGTGSVVRVAVKTRPRAVGEDSSSSHADDEEAFTAVTVTTTTIGEIFKGVVSLTPSKYTIGDNVGFAIGRDGGNEISGGGSSDDYNKRTELTGLLLEVK